MFRSQVVQLMVVMGIFVGIKTSAEASQLWQCGDAAELAVTIYESDKDPSPGVLQGPQAPQVLTGPAVALDCVMQGEGLGTEWICSGLDNIPTDLIVEVRRGQHTGDPWAWATVRMGERMLVGELPCAVQQVRDTRR